jgi:hypothetical protein
MIETPVDPSEFEAAFDYEAGIARQANVSHMRTLKITVVMLLIAIVGLAGALAKLESRPPYVVGIGLDAAGHTKAQVMSDDPITPQMAQVEQTVQLWATYRYRLAAQPINNDFSLNYYFMSEKLHSLWEAKDNEAAAEILAGKREPQDVRIVTVKLPPYQASTRNRRSVLIGKAVIDMLVRKGDITGPDSDDIPHEHWNVDLEYVIDPVGAVEWDLRHPGYLAHNPLGFTIETWFETRYPDVLPIKKDSFGGQ